MTRHPACWIAVTVLALGATYIATVALTLAYDYDAHLEVCDD